MIYLGFSSNNIGKEGCLHIVQALVSCNQLSELNLSYNSIPSDMKKEIKQILPKVDFYI